MTSFLQDLRFALRSFGRRPAFTTTAALTLALGIGANVAVFSAIDAVLFRPPPVDAPDRLVRLYMSYEGGFRYGSFSYPDYVDQRDRNEAFSAIALYRAIPMAVSVTDRAERTWGKLVSANYFATLGVRPVLGRAFGRAEAAGPGEPAVAVLAHEYWRSRFGGAPDVVGRTIDINGHPFTIIGVAPRGFYGVQKGMRTALWMPAVMQPQVMPGGSVLEARGERSFTVTGRLRHGITLDQARARTPALLGALSDELGGAYDRMSITMIPENDVGLAPQFAGAANAGGTLLLVVAALLLLIGCVNVANLFLARAAGRRREIGVRAAIGATRGRLVRQLMTESIVLAIIAGAAGVLIAYWAASALAGVRLPVDLPVVLDFRIDGRVLTYAFVVSVLTAIVFGLTPALQSARPDVMRVLRGGADASAARASRLGRALVAGQVALCTLILVAMGLFVRSLQELRSVDPGFEVEHQLLVALDPGLVGYDSGRGRAFYRDLLDRVEALPGVRGVGLGEVAPFSLSDQQRTISGVDGYDAGPDDNLVIDYNVVTPTYFATMDVPLLHGRTFRASDDGDSRPVMIVNRAMAERFWADGGAVGGTVRLGGTAVQVVGVVDNVKLGSLREEPRPVFFLPFAGQYSSSMILHVRTANDPLALAPEVREIVRALDPDVPIFGVRSMAEQVGLALFPARAGTLMLGAFGLLGLVLAGVGLYGVMAYLISQRTREFALRVALGAAPAELVRMIVGQGGRLALVGLAVGLVAALAMSRLMAGLLYGVRSHDPVTFAVVAFVLGGVGLTASYLPARRAADVDPMTALRRE